MANGKFNKFIYKNGKRKILKGKISCKIKNELGKTYLRKKGKSKWKAKKQIRKRKMSKQENGSCRNLETKIKNLETQNLKRKSNSN